MTVASPKQRGKRRVQGWISTNSPSTWPKARLQSGHRQSPWRSSAFVGSTQDSSDLVMMVKSMRHLTMSTIAPIVHPDSIPVYLQSVSPSDLGRHRRLGNVGQVRGSRAERTSLFPSSAQDPRIVNVRHICRDRAHRRSTCAPPAIGQQPLGMPLGAVEMDRGRWSSRNQESHSRSRNRTRSRGSTPPQPTDVLRPSVNPVAECRPRKYRLYPSRIQMNALVLPSNADSAGRRVPTMLSGIHSDPRTGPAARTGR